MLGTRVCMPASMAAALANGAAQHTSVQTSMHLINRLTVLIRSDFSLMQPNRNHHRGTENTEQKSSSGVVNQRHHYFYSTAPLLHYSSTVLFSVHSVSLW